MLLTPTTMAVSFMLFVVSFYSLSSPGEDLSSPRCFCLSKLSDFLCLSYCSLSISPLLLWVARPSFPFHFCHRQSPSLSKCTWLNIGPQMIIKPRSPQACKIWAQAHCRLLPPVRSLFPSFPSCLETLVPAWTHCVFVFISKKLHSSNHSPLMCVFRDLKLRLGTKEKEERQRKQRDGWRSKMEKEIFVCMRNNTKLNIFSQTCSP